MLFLPSQIPTWKNIRTHNRRIRQNYRVFFYFFILRLNDIICILIEIEKQTKTIINIIICYNVMFQRLFIYR